MKPLIYFNGYRFRSALTLLLSGFLILLLICSCSKDVWPGDPDQDPLPESGILDGFPVIDVHQHIYNASNFWSSGYDHIPLRRYMTPVGHYEALVQCMKDNHVVLALAGSTLEAVDYS